MHASEQDSSAQRHAMRLVVLVSVFIKIHSSLPAHPYTEILRKFVLLGAFHTTTHDFQSVFMLPFL